MTVGWCTYLANHRHKKKRRATRFFLPPDCSQRSEYGTMYAASKAVSTGKLVGEYESFLCCMMLMCQCTNVNMVMLVHAESSVNAHMSCGRDREEG